MAEQRFSLITDESLADNIRHYAHGIGDDNPLWCDPDYAATTAYGSLVAPPSFVFPLNRILSGYVGGLPGVHAMWAGADLDWHAPMLRGDAFTTTAWLKDLIEHDTRFAGRAIQQVYHVEYYNQHKTLVASGDSWCFRTERDTARERGTKYTEVKQRQPVQYSRDAIAEIFAQYAEETVRGATPRYIEDVRVGDAQGWGGLYIRANRLAWKQLKKHPGLGIPDRFGIPDVPERVHWDGDLATLVGTPDAYDYGPERTSWMTHHLTDWMGDAGFLRHIHVEIRRHNPVGDTLYISGEVTRIFEQDTAHYVEIAQTAKNQNDELSVRATATVRLPSRTSEQT